MGVSALEDELREVIRRGGPIPFARFQDACLYSPRGGFYATRTAPISDSFQTAPTSHPLFGRLLARQLEEMWQVLGSPPVFDVVEVGSGDGSLARAITAATSAMTPAFAGALRYVASDYAPVWPSRPGVFDLPPETAEAAGPSPVDRVRADGLQPFQGVDGCIIANELLDNFPVHRFAIQGGRVLEVFVALEGDAFVEVLDVPSTGEIEERVRSAGVPLVDGLRGEVCLGLDRWAAELARVLKRGFVLTIDYGGLAAELLSGANPEGTLVCFKDHMVGNEPLSHVGEQDITAHVDFSAFMRLGEANGLATVGYAAQLDFLAGLGFQDAIDELNASDMNDVRKEFQRIAMLSLVDPEQTGDFRVLIQARGVDVTRPLRGLAVQLPRR